MAMPWLQRRTFSCADCGALMLHDQMYGHWAFTCPSRPRPPVRVRPAPFVGRTYCPVVGRYG